MSLAARKVVAVRPEIVEIFADLFHTAEDLTPETSPDQIERWDSLQHIALVRALEQTFGIAMSMDEMMEIRSVGDIEAVLSRHGV